jgi:hypothetical protein
LCASGEAFVKSIETLPAFALSVFVLYSSWPSLFASRLRLLAALDGAAALEELVVGAAALEELVAGGAAAVVLDELELELPQPVSAASAANSASDEIEKTERLVACPAAICLTSPPSVGVVVGMTPLNADTYRLERGRCPPASPGAYALRPAARSPRRRHRARNGE